MQFESVRSFNVNGNIITNALDAVLDWNLPDGAFENAFQAQVGVLAGEGWD